MAVNTEVIQTVAQRIRESQSPSSLHEIKWRDLTPTQASLIFGLVDFLADEENALQSGERPSEFRVKRAIQQLPALINGSKNCRGFSSLLGLPSEEFQTQLQHYTDGISANAENREYLPAHRDVLLCDGFIYSLLGNVVHEDLRQLWRDSWDSSFAAATLGQWLHQNLEGGKSLGVPLTPPDQPK